MSISIIQTKISYFIDSVQNVTCYTPPMENSFERPETQPSLDYTSLKAELLSGTRDLAEIKEILKDVDQETPTHDAAPDNLAFLTDPEIVEFMATQPEDIQRAYNQFLSFTEWHIGQQKIFTGDVESGIEMLKQSLEHDYKGQAFLKNIAHKRGTLAYFDHDTATLEDSISQQEDGDKNKKILIHLLEGLQERGAPDYLIDYSKE